MATSHKLLFRWRGLATDGLPRCGWAMAHATEDLSQRLATDGITLLKARRQRMAYFKTAAAYHFLNQLASLLNVGVPILDALQLIAQDKTSRQLEAVFCGIIENLESGLALSASLTPFLRRSDDIIVRVLALGERSGKFNEVLARLLEQRKKSVRAHAQLKRAAAYPVMLALISLIVVLLMMIWVVPEFNSIYADFGATLPAYTLAIIGLSEFVVANGLSLALWSAAVVGVLMTLQHKSPRLQYLLARAQLRLPLTGWFLKTKLYCQFAADINLIYHAGMPLGEALAWLASTSTQLRYRAALEYICDNVSRGLSLNESLAGTHFFPHFIVQTVRIGENSGSLQQAFERIENFYAEALENATEKMIKLFEPLLVAVLSLIVGALVIAMYLPMFNLGFAL